MQLDQTNTMRYCRHILLPHVQEEGQEKLMSSHVLVIGAGGLGCAALPYLAASGIGKITVFDGDTVDVTNLQRQILHPEHSVGVNKVESAKKALALINTQNQIDIHATHFKKQHEHCIENADVVIDCSDNLTTRLLINKLCWQHQTPLISGSAIRMEGQIIHFPMRNNDPCYECIARLFTEPNLSCMEAGVLSPVVGTIGTLQATEAIKSLLGLNPDQVALTLYDAQTLTFKTFKIAKHTHCKICQPRT